MSLQQFHPIRTYPVTGTTQPIAWHQLYTKYLVPGTWYSLVYMITRRLTKQKTECTREPYLWYCCILKNTHHAEYRQCSRICSVPLLLLSHIIPVTTRNPFLRTKLLGFGIGRGSGALKELTLVKHLESVVTQRCWSPRKI